LVTEGKTVISYQESREKYAEEQAEARESGPYIAGVGSFTLLFDLFWRTRRKRREERMV
jgi:hypothetical protein